MITEEDYNILQCALTKVLGNHVQGDEGDEILAELNHELLYQGIVHPFASPVPTDFDVFWRLYSKKVGKEKCQKFWKRLPKKDRDAILAYLPAYVAATPNLQFRKNPLTFLHQRGWEDEIITPNSPANHHNDTIMQREDASFDGMESFG